MGFRANHPFTFLLPLVSSISRVLRARFGKKDDEDDCDKKDEDGEKKTKHSIDGILGDKCKLTQNVLKFRLSLSWSKCLPKIILEEGREWEEGEKTAAAAAKQFLPALILRARHLFVHAIIYESLGRRYLTAEN